MLNKELLCARANAAPLGVGELEITFYSDDARDVLSVEVVFQDGTQDTFRVKATIKEYTTLKGNAPIVRFSLRVTSDLFDGANLWCVAEPKVNSIFGAYNVSDVAVAEKPFAYVSKMKMDVSFDIV